MLGNGPTHADADGVRPNDPRAEEIDTGITAALACGEVDGFFLDLDAGVSRELGCRAARPGSCWRGPIPS